MNIITLILTLMLAITIHITIDNELQIEALTIKVNVLSKAIDCAVANTMIEGSC